jgi:hypothetical protein
MPRPWDDGDVCGAFHTMPWTVFKQDTDRRSMPLQKPGTHTHFQALHTSPEHHISPPKRADRTGGAASALLNP